MPKVLISDKLSPAAVEIFRERGVEVDFKPGLDKDELHAIIGDYDGLAIRSATKVTPKLLEAASTLKVVGRAGIGVDNVDVRAATAKGVVVMNTPFGNSITTAEHAIAMMFALARQIPEADVSTRASKWEKSRFMGVELFAKTLGLIGCGNIGSIVADRALGLKMRVLAYDPFLSPERAIELGVRKVELDEVLAHADLITLHTPLTDQTRNILGREALARTKRGVRIVNCARGGLIDEQALYDALVDGHVAGAALDVFAEEPAKENKLFTAPNIVCTPHLGASTKEAQENVALQIARQMADYLVDGAVTNALNMASVTAEEAPRLRPYLTLADQIGSFAGQITESGIEAINIEFAGEVSQLNVKPLTAAILTGLLRPFVQTVNGVSAPIIARDRDIDVSETLREKTPDYHTLIRLTVTTERRTRTVAGSLFGAGKPRLTEVEGVPLEAEVAEHMLFVRNDDKPGLIGHLGSALGDAGINIATFHLGRKEQGRDAIALVAMDQPAPGDLVAQVCRLPSVQGAKVLTF